MIMKRAMILLGSSLLMGAAPGSEQQQPMTFFITSAGPGSGAALGGIAGADRHCQTLAEAAGSTGRQWRAYLSTPAIADAAAVHARDRIGPGPWHNAKGVLIARNVAHLHSDSTGLGKENSITEKGTVVNGRGDTPNTHDIITGSNLDGTAFSAAGYNNCDNYTSSAATGGTRLGHHDRQGGGENPTSWNSAHTSRGCGQQNLVATGGAGLFYCFALAR
jgi:hypothetical protein